MPAQAHGRDHSYQRDGRTRQVRTCACGRNVWDVAALPSPTKRIVCACGADHSRPISPRLRLRYAWYKARKLWRLYRLGVRAHPDWRLWWWRRWRDVWFLPRERETARSFSRPEAPSDLPDIIPLPENHGQER